MPPENRPASPIRHWWQEWGLIDLVALGGGLALAAAYVIVSHAVDPQSPLQALVPNLATEIVGVWLSVRIIERLIRRRDSFHAVRRGMLVEFSTLDELLAGFLSYPYEWRVAEFEGRIMVLRNNWGHLAQYLFPDERAQADACIELAADAPDPCRRYIQSRGAIEDLKYRIERFASESNSVRTSVRYAIEGCFRIYKSKYFVNLDDRPLDLSDLNPKLNRIRARASMYLSPKDLSAIARVASDLAEKPLRTYMELLSVELETDAIAEHVWLGEIDWHQELIKLAGDLQGPRTSGWTVERRERIEAAILGDAESYPQPLITLSRKHLRLVNELAQAVRAVSQLHSEFSQKVDELKVNVSAEIPVARIFE